MKNAFVVLLLLTLVVSTGFAQLGIKGGLSLSKYGGSDVVNTPDNRTAFVAGVSYKIGLLMGLSIQPEVLYAQKGDAMSIPGFSGKVTEKVDYIEIPVLVKFAPLPIPVIKPFVEVGASYSILMSAKEVDEISSPSTTTDVKDAYQKNDVSLIVGAGADLSLLVINLTIDVRYVMGQTKVSKLFPDKKVYNRGIEATVGLNF